MKSCIISSLPNTLTCWRLACCLICTPPSCSATCRRHIFFTYCDAISSFHQLSSSEYQHSGAIVLLGVWPKWMTTTRKVSNFFCFSMLLNYPCPVNFFLFWFRGSYPQTFLTNEQTMTFIDIFWSGFPVWNQIEPSSKFNIVTIKSPIPTQQTAGLKTSLDTFQVKHCVTRSSRLFPPLV